MQSGFAIQYNSIQLYWCSVCSHQGCLGCVTVTQTTVWALKRRLREVFICTFYPPAVYFVNLLEPECVVIVDMANLLILFVRLKRRHAFQEQRNISSESNIWEILTWNQLYRKITIIRSSVFPCMSWKGIKKQIYFVPQMWLELRIWLIKADIQQHARVDLW